MQKSMPPSFGFGRAGWIAGCVVAAALTAVLLIGVVDIQYIKAVVQQPQASIPSEHRFLKLPIEECAVPCLDVLLLYHEDDATMFVDNGVLKSVQQHLVGVRKVIVMSQSNASFLHLVDNRTEWFDEARAPFSQESFVGSKRPQGWLFQQTLKMWAVANMKNVCNNILVADSDVLWLKDFNVLTMEPHVPGQPCKAPRIKYNLASMDSGAWYGDITNDEYQHFVNFLLGMPKVLANTHTAINNWQVMQQDVMQALERSVRGRGFSSLQDALIHYGKNYNGMSEYEAYFSYAWYFYRDRIDPVYLPWILRSPERCNLFVDSIVGPFQRDTSVAYFTCHDNYASDDYYINCKGREAQCDPQLAKQGR